MNPRYRRMLIPGLLITLVVVVLITSLAREARGAPGRAHPGAAAVVCTLTDARIGESSGLALSMTHPGLAYTINDSGNAPRVYAVALATGEVVGTTQVRGGALRDTEALAIDAAGTLWIADTGDNRNRRDDAALYALPEPGAGEHTVVAARYPIRYSADRGQAARPNVEALLINPVSGAKFLVTKGLLAGDVFTLPATLTTKAANPATPVDATMPAMVTDGAITPDGRTAVIRNYGVMSVYDAATWRLIRTDALPAQPQGETLAVEAGANSVLIGSEGRHSQLLRVPLRRSPDPVAQPAASPARPAGSAADRGPEWWSFTIPAALVLAVGALVLRRRR